MKIIYMSTFFLSTLYSSFVFSFGNIEMVWVPSNGVNVSSPSVTVNDYNNVGNVNITTVNGFAAVKSASHCDVQSISGTKSVDRVVKFAIPEDLIASGNEPSIKFGRLSGSSLIEESSGLTGHRQYYRSYPLHAYEGSVGCSPVGTSTGGDLVPIPAQTFLLPYEVFKGNAYPGDYRLSIPVYIGIYENFCSIDGPCRDNGLLGGPNFWGGITNQSRMFVDVNVKIKSKCQISQRTVNLDYGRISRNEIRDRKITSYYDLQCNSPTRVSVKILDGATDSSGKGRLVSCGDSLQCLVSVNDRISDNISVNGVERLSISSQLKPVGDKIKAGDFSGSAILEILIL